MEKAVQFHATGIYLLAPGGECIFLRLQIYYRERLDDILVAIQVQV